ncbi:MaoC/PaaZ C-terminal domain-containing protein [Rhodococcus erythropolis]|uniref:MaoC/PaaZ C-terminal domain-containing protein n=1 Tax=Rhodococcus erythropolis TaxID=1833 RepID=UPI003B00C54B
MERERIRAFARATAFPLLVSAIRGQAGLRATSRSGRRAAGVLADAVDTVEADQSTRYAEVSGDHQGVHLDAAVARTFGFAGVVNHGNCTFAVASQHVAEHVCQGDSRRLTRLALPVSRPVCLGQRVTTSVSAAGHTPHSRAFQWSSRLNDGAECLSSGLRRSGRLLSHPPLTNFMRHALSKKRGSWQDGDCGCSPVRT